MDTDVDAQPPGEIDGPVGRGVIDQQEMVGAPDRQGADRPLQGALRLVGGEGDDGEMTPGPIRSPTIAEAPKPALGRAGPAPGAKSCASPYQAIASLGKTAGHPQEELAPAASWGALRAWLPNQHLHLLTEVDGEGSHRYIEQSKVSRVHVGRREARVRDYRADTLASGK